MVGAPTQGSGRTIGRYVLFDEIASGGMATVHFARLSGPVGFARTVAIKRLHPHLAKDPEFVTMFLDEARLAARIRHPNVVPTLDVVAMDHEVFIVMEYVQGEALSRLLRAQQARGKPMPVPYAAAIIANVLHGLHAAHEARDEQGQPLGIVHRDVSPQNVLVGSDGATRVLDFGVAKAAGRLQDTRDGALKGKVAYMSPEQLSGRAVTRRSDLYSAAVVLWEVLAGRRLFEGITSEVALVAKVLESILHPWFEPPSKYNPEVPKAIDDLVLRALSGDPEARFATAREMAQLLEKNGGLVAASELGDWVESLASEVLSRRAARLSDIEAKGRDGGPPAEGRPSRTHSIDAETAVAGAAVAETAVAETAVAEPGTATGLTLSGPRTTRNRALATVAALLVVGATASTAIVMRSRVESPPRGGAGTSSSGAPLGGNDPRTGEPSGASAEGTVDRPSPSAVPSTASASPASSGRAAASAASSPSLPPRVTAVTAARPTTPARTASPKPDDCDPPYVIDAEGHKVYKRQCLK